MQYDEVVLGRRSIRGYKPDPVPQSLIEEILALAMRSPSSMNTQPWNFTVVTGEVLDRIRKGNTERNLAGVPHSREFRIGSPFAGQHRDRQVGVAKQLFAQWTSRERMLKSVRTGYCAGSGSLMRPCVSSLPTMPCSRTVTTLPLTAVRSPRHWLTRFGLEVSERSSIARASCSPRCKRARQYLR